MPAVVNLAPIGNAFNFATQGWLPLNQGKLYTYLAGSSTPKETYTTADGDVQNDNPIILGVDGRPPSEIWLVSGFSYLFLLKDSNDNEIGSYDDLTGINDTSQNDCCPRFGTATSSNGQTFDVEFATPVTSLEGPLTYYVVFDDDQTISAPTLNADSTGDLLMVEGLDTAIPAYRILAGDILQIVYNEDEDTYTVMNLHPLETFMAAPGDQDTIITTGTKFTAPGFPGGRIIGLPVGGVATASSSGVVTLNIKEGGVSVLSTAITIDANETSSITAATQPVVSDHVIANNATLTLTVDGAGTSAKGPLWQFLYRRVNQ